LEYPEELYKLLL